MAVALAAGVAAGVPSCGPAGEAPSPAGSLEVEPASIALGDLAPGVPVSIQVALRNRSDRPLSILAAVPSCPCVRATLPASPVPPGGSAECTVTLDPPAVASDESVMKTVVFMPERGDPVPVILQGIVRAALGPAPSR